MVNLFIFPHFECLLRLPEEIVSESSLGEFLLPERGCISAAATFHQITQKGRHVFFYSFLLPLTDRQTDQPKERLVCEEKNLLN